MIDRKATGIIALTDQHGKVLGYVEARIIGCLGVHRSQDLADRWAITHVPTGGRVAACATEQLGAKIAAWVESQVPPGKRADWESKDFIRVRQTFGNLRTWKRVLRTNIKRLSK